MRKGKIIVRIIAGLLVTITVLGMIVPYVAATETNESSELSEAIEMLGLEEVLGTALPSEGIEEDTADGVDQTEDQEAVADAVEIPKPTSNLPNGFEYVQSANSWVVKKSEGNTKPAVMLGAPYGFDTYVVMVFVGNLQTHEVKCFELYNGMSYVSSMDLDDGYYVIFANGYAWSDADGNAYAINGGDYQYIYVGDDYDENIYGVEFNSAEEIFSVSLEPASDNMKTIEYNGALVIDVDELTYPEDAKLVNLVEYQEQVPTQPNQIEKDPNVGDGDKDKEHTSIWTRLLDIVKESAFELICIAACWVGLLIIKGKKRKAEIKRLEDDMRDEKRVE